MIVASITLMFFALQTMSMSGVENSVGFHASGTSVEPKTTSESSGMIHRPLGNWTMMLHGNAFVLDIQQTGPRGLLLAGGCSIPPNAYADLIQAARAAARGAS